MPMKPNPIDNLAPAELAGQMLDVDRPANELVLMLDGSGPVLDLSRWVPASDAQWRLAETLGVCSPMPVGLLIQKCALAKVAVSFRGDLPPLGDPGPPLPPPPRRKRPEPS